MNADTIREFLVGLGFQVDEAGLKNFQEKLAAATKTAMELGKGVLEAAAAITAGVIKISDSFEDLYYASQRLHSSVTNIKGWSFGVTQMGGDARGARESLEGLANFMRSSPGSERFLGTMGVQTREANGEMRDTTAIMKDLGQQFKAMPYYMAKVRAQTLGIDEKTLQAMIRGVDEFSDHYAAMAKNMGMDQDAAALSSRNFMNTVRDLLAWLDLAAAKFTVIAQGPLGRIATAMTQADKATKGLASALVVVIGLLVVLGTILSPQIAIATALAGAILLLYDDFMTWKEGGKSLIDWGSWAPIIDLAVEAFQMLGGALVNLGEALVEVGKKWGIFWALGGIAKYVIGAIVNEFEALAHAINAVADLLRGDFKGAWNEAKEFGKSELNAVTGNNPNVKRDPVTGLVDHSQDATTGSAGARTKALASQAAAAVKPTADTVAAGARQAVMYFQARGWSREQAAGIAANIQSESDFNPQAVGDGGKARGLSQWHADRQEAFKAWAGHDIQQSNFAEQLGFIHYELTQGSERRAGDMLRHATTAQDAGAIVSRDYERPKAAAAAMAERGAMATKIFDQTALAPPQAAGGGDGTQVTINQKTDINVTGGGQPQAIANRVASEQDRVNSDLLRNTKGAVQ